VIRVDRPGSRAAAYLGRLAELYGGSRRPVVVRPGPLHATTPQDGSAVCSPWVLRKNDRLHWEGATPTHWGSHDVFAFSQAGIAEPVVWLLASAATAMTVLRTPARNDDGGPVRDGLITLLLHTADLLKSRRKLLAEVKVRRIHRRSGSRRRPRGAPVARRRDAGERRD
jgi:hypothetical protein